MGYHVIARYGAMRSIGVFRSDLALRRGEQCILRTARGVELGETVDKAYDPAPEEQNSSVGQVLRRATERDLTRMQEIEEQIAPQEYNFCARKISEHELPMKLVSVEHLFGGDKIIFYFLAEGRVDFRALVKDLAGQYRTRIEMRQIGVRDEARLLADFEHCGRELCCRSFMKDLAPVTMRMAKAQKTTLDPAKISGRCGRLMCCLRFEDQVYAELRDNLPKRGTRVRTPQGEGVVLGSETLKQTVTVELSDNRDVVFPVADLEVLPDPKGKGKGRGKGKGKGRGKGQGGRQDGQPRSDAGDGDAGSSGGDPDGGPNGADGDETEGS
jgi:cell fate regulator YaaT (PSP1 superfamily)